MWVVEIDHPEWGLKAGDVLTLDWRSERPMWKCSELPPLLHGALDGLWERGIIRCLNDLEAGAVRISLRPAVPDVAAPDRTPHPAAPAPRVLPLRPSLPTPPDPAS